MLFFDGETMISVNPGGTARIGLPAFEEAADLLKTTIVASIGPVTAEAAAQCHIQTTIMPSQYTVTALVEAIVEYFEKQKEAT